jgi:bifunctional UDP-N-acetylglucosamine pyrophosphorylase/glucosamine-1-phosphate N-acetyltransferase
MELPLAAVILAAGQGTRMKSKVPKVLHELCGAPMVTYPIRLAKRMGAEPVVLVIGHGADLIRRFIGGVRFEVQAEQRGTGHAVMEGMRGLDGFEGRILILYGDVPLLTKETIEGLTQKLDRGARLAIVTTMLEDPFGYGRIVRDAREHITRVVEEKDATPEQRKIREINAGIYCTDSEFLRSALSRLVNDNAQGEYYLTDIVGLAIQDGHAVEAYVCPDPGEVQGANTRAQLAELAAILRRRVNAEHMKNGVSIVDPETTYIGTEVEIGTDTVIEAGVHLRGKTVIGSGCHVDAGAILIDARLHDGATVHPYSVIEEGVLHADAQVGPFARIRPGAELMEGSRVGNFVELKKTKLGRGSKANHLAYLGDSEIGAGANIGAGTITCNYDGYGKYKTVIGDEVFVGSNSTLVAPVEVGRGAYVAAGSTITDPVGPDDLAFGRARQTVKAARAKELRAAAKAKADAAKKK